MTKQATKVLPGHELTVPLAIVARRAFGGKWMTWQRGLTTLSSGSWFTFTGTKSRNIHLRHPDLVTATVTTIGKLAGPTRAAELPGLLSSSLAAWAAVFGLIGEGRGAMLSCGEGRALLADDVRAEAARRSR